MNKMLLNNECATYLENVPQQIFQSTQKYKYVDMRSGPERIQKISVKMYV